MNGGEQQLTELTGREAMREDDQVPLPLGLINRV